MPDDCPRLSILIADDTDTDRLILASIIRNQGHEVLTARDGQEAVEIFTQEKPDIVLLDALMPRLDGFGAARQIKELAGEQLVPIIFLTSLTDTESQVRCLEAGGDDFLSKPYNRVILQAKIKSFNRMREMHSTILAQRDQIALHNEHLLQEQRVAKQVFDNIAHTGCLDASNVRYLLSPLAVFNGDVLLATIHPSGNMMVLLGDFTGHGLPAAIGAMPLASIFYGMSQKGYSMVDILREMNLKLKQILPVGVFCCATLVEVSFNKQKIKLWNGGLPDGYICRAITGQVEPIQSRHLPLGILSDQEFRDDCLVFEMARGDRFYLMSDGILEARNGQGDMFGQERLEAVFNSERPIEGLFDQILSAVQVFCAGDCRDDDLSLIEVTMVPQADIVSESDELARHPRGNGLMEWSLELEVKSSTFKVFDPLPLLLRVLVEVPGLRRHSGSLYTILAELYNNSLEHGILGLKSTWKDTPDGFSHYYQERIQRLKQLESGFIRFNLSHETISEGGGALKIVVEDSGPGFAYDNEAVDQVGPDSYSGRGIVLIRSLCQSLRYMGNGNKVEAVFTWQVDQ